MTFQSFWEALSLVPTGAEAPVLVAGLAALHQYRAIRARGHNAADVRALSSIRAEVEQIVGFDPLRSSIIALTDALPLWEQSEPVVLGRRIVYGALVQFGSALFAGGLPKLAIDVLGVVAVDAELDGYYGLSAQARLLCGFAFRTIAAWDDSEAAYQRADQLAAMAGEFSVVVRSMVGRANNAAGRGDLPGARELLRTAAVRAKRLAPETLPRVIIAQANVENLAGQYERAVTLGYRALHAAVDPESRVLTLVDLAHFFADYGARDVAKDALRWVIASDIDVRHRVQAQLNLLALIASEHDDVFFETLRDELASAPFTARQHALYHLHVAQGSRRRGQFRDATKAASTALALAHEHRLFQITFDAEGELRAIADAESTAVPSEKHEVDTPVSPQIDRIVRRVRAMLAEV